jgi:hypothetical protein
MPLSDIQAEVLRVIAANRSPDSYLAGATVLHRRKRTPRFSQDIDLFHDAPDDVLQSARKDSQTLQASGYDFDWVQQTPFFCQAVVRIESKQLKIEWAQDSAFRFFPLQQDDFCGYRLHDADAATNKLLALAGRAEVRDFVDILYLHETFLSLGALAWAACGKDPGFTPGFLLDHAGRHVCYTQSDVDRLELSSPLNIKELKVKWIGAVEHARRLVSLLPASEIGCLYLDRDAIPVCPDPGYPDVAGLIRHSGSLRGAWPVVSES